MKTKLTILFATVALAGVAIGAPETFDFKDPKGGNNIMFKLVAPKETISGSASGVSGTITFDPDKPETLKGKIVVASQSLTVPNAMMKSHLQSSKWVDAKQYPEISFESKEIKNAKKDGDAIAAEVTGAFTLHGVTKDITAPVKLTYMKDKLGERIPNKKGDLLVIRTTFTIKRSDFNINPGQNEDKVSNDIELTLNLAGASPK